MWSDNWIVGIFWFSFSSSKPYYRVCWVHTVDRALISVRPISSLCLSILRTGFTARLRSPPNRLNDRRSTGSSQRLNQVNQLKPHPRWTWNESTKSISQSEAANRRSQWIIQFIIIAKNGNMRNQSLRPDRYDRLADDGQEALSSLQSGQRGYTPVVSLSAHSY